MKRYKIAFSTVLSITFALIALDCPSKASAALIDYTAVITVTTGATTGFLTADPTYWTPLIGSTQSAAIVVSFALNGTAGTQIDLATIKNTNENAFPDLGLVQGRDNTSANIGSGNFNYLYLDNTNSTPAGSTPQNVGNYFANTNSLTKASESAVWSIDITGLTGTLTPQWINSDTTTPTTEVFVQTNHVYAGGDQAAFHARYPAPVTSATLGLDILSAVPVATPEPASLGMLALGLLGTGVFWRKMRTKGR